MLTTWWRAPLHRGLLFAVVAAVATLLIGLPTHGAARPRSQPVAHSIEPAGASTSRPEPLRLSDSALEPIDWHALDGWAVDDHAAAFATFLASCRPLLRTIRPEGETRPMYFALMQVCRRALAAGRLAREQAQMFFEHNFRPLRIAKLGDSAGFLTGYYEPIVGRVPVPDWNLQSPNLSPPPRFGSAAK
jgi:membrane-bound lytic murein transglycosylase A